MLLSIPKTLRALRVAHAFSQKEAADAMGVSVSYFNQVERGKRKPGLGFLAKAHMTFGVPLHLLVPREGELDDELQEELAEILVRVLAAHLVNAGEGQ